MRPRQGILAAAAATAIGLVAVGCEAGVGDAELGLASHVQLLTSSDRVVLEDVSLTRGEILVRVARGPLNDQCGELIVVDFDGSVETLANDIVMPLTGPVNGNFAAFAPTSEDVAYVTNGCKLGPWSLRVLTPNAPQRNLLDSVGEIVGWNTEPDLLVSRRTAEEGAPASIWRVASTTADAAEVASGQILGASPDASTLVLAEGSGIALRTGSEVYPLDGIPTSAGSDGSEFSPDGSKYLYYASSGDELFADLAVAGLTEKSQSVILPYGGNSNEYPAKVVAWAPSGEAVLVQGMNSPQAILIDVDTVERSLAPLQVSANRVFWRGTALIYGNSAEIWVAFTSEPSEDGNSTSELADQFRSAFPSPLDLTSS